MIILIDLIGNVGFMGQDLTHNILGVEGTFDLKKHILEHPSKTHQTPSKKPIRIVKFCYIPLTKAINNNH